MIATVTYQVLGSEPVIGGQREVYFHAASGMQIIDVIINGVSQDFAALNIEQEYGKVAKAGLVKGDWVSCTYKTLPKFVYNYITSPMEEFLETDFTDDFV
jgi:hypothetical protein